MLFQSRPGSLSRDEIVTGERLLGLAEIAVVPRSIYEFHRNLESYAREIAAFEDGGELDDRIVARISAKRSIFVYTHALPDFIERIWPQLQGGNYVLITHNSDHEVDASYVPWIEGSKGKLQRWFAQNVTVDHGKIVPLPIGIANSMWKHGNLRALYRAIRRTDYTEKTRLVDLRFNPATHPRRGQVWDALRANFGHISDAPPAPKSFRRYLADLASHKFCVCPRGNGVDTHRFWECQYLGVVPIVERSVHSEHWRSCGLPSVIVDDWREVTPERLEAETAQTSIRPSARDQLQLSHYARLVRAAEAGMPAPSDGGVATNV